MTRTSRECAPYPRARILPYGQHPPARNMAWDAWLLEHAEVPTLRLYGWDPHGISVGYFQERRQGLGDLPRLGWPLVRRMTGGGAILHAHELTYALVLTESHPWLDGADREESYHRLHLPILRALDDLGVDATAGESSGSQAGSDPVLCFQRTTASDLRARDRKLVGSAQRHWNSKILQHGSILLRPHPEQPGPITLEELLGVAPSAPSLAQFITRRFAELFQDLEVLIPDAAACSWVTDQASSFDLQADPTKTSQP